MLGQMTKNAQGIWASACAHALLLTGCAFVALALAALPWAYGERWTAYGVLIAAAQLAVAYTLIDRAIDSYEDRKWHNARQEFMAGRRSSFTKDDERSRYKAATTCQSIDTRSAHLLRCAKAIEESGICLVRLPQTLGSGL